MERLDYDLLFRWFIGLGIDDRVWNHSTFSKNRDRVLTADIAQRLFDEIKKQAYAKRLMSRDHFSVDGTLVEASASMKSFVPKEPSKSEDDTKGPKAETRTLTSKARNERTIRIIQPLILMHVCIARASARAQSCATWGTSSQRIVMA